MSDSNTPNDQPISDATTPSGAGLGIATLFGLLAKMPGGWAGQNGGQHMPRAEGVVRLEASLSGPRWLGVEIKARAVAVQCSVTLDNVSVTNHFLRTLMTFDIIGSRSAIDEFGKAWHDKYVQDG